MINYVPLFQQQRKFSLADTFHHFSQHLIDSIYFEKKKKVKEEQHKKENFQISPGKSHTKKFPFI